MTDRDKVPDDELQAFDPDAEPTEDPYRGKDVNQEEDGYDGNDD